MSVSNQRIRSNQRPECQPRQKPQEGSSFCVRQGGFGLVFTGLQYGGSVKTAKGEVKIKIRFSQEWKGNLIISSLAVGRKRGENLVW